MITEAEIREMYFQTKECQGFLATPEAKSKAWNKFFRSPRESMALLIL